MKQENKKFLGKGGLSVALILGVTVMLVLSFTTNFTEIISSIGQKGWCNIATAGTPPAGESGVYFIYIYPHQAVPYTAYKTNLTNASAYAYGSLNATLTGSVPSGTAFDIVVKVRYNATHAFNTTSTDWVLSWTRGNITCASLSIGAYTAMSQSIIAANNASAGGATDYMFEHYWINNADAGYTISHGQTINVTLFSMQAYY